jgi:hypothetical protein
MKGLLKRKIEADRLVKNQENSFESAKSEEAPNLLSFENCTEYITLKH